MTSPREIRTRPQEHCIACGTAGETVYSHLSDTLFEAPGSWSIRRCINAGCGLHWLNPMPIEEDLPKAYENYYTHSQGFEASAPGFAMRLNEFARRGYWATHYGYELGQGRAGDLAGMLIALNPLVRPLADQKVMHLSANPGGRLLEIGFGRGEVLRRMEAFGWRVVGVDFDPVVVEHATASGLDAFAGTLEQQAFPDNHFDAIIMSHVIEHLVDPIATLAECKRVLADSGILVLITPNIRSMGHRKFGSAWRGLEPPRHMFVFSPPSLEAVTRTAGFSDIQIKTTVRDAHGSYLASRLIAEGKDRSSSERRQLHDALRSRLFQLNEWIWNLLRRDCGNEIVLVARSFLTPR